MFMSWNLGGLAGEPLLISEHVLHHLWELR